MPKPGRTSHWGEETQIARQQWKLLLRNLPGAFFANALVCVAFGVAMWLQTGDKLPLVWMAVAFATQIARWGVWRVCRRRAVAGPGLNLARRAILASTVGGGLVWGVGLPLVLPAENTEFLMLAGVIVAGLNAGAMVSSMPVVASFLAFILPLNLPIAVYYASLGGPLNALLVVALLGFTVIMIAVARNAARQSRENHAMRLAQARLIRELRTAHAAVARSDLAKSRFLATMSHELRTPLNIVLGFAKTLEDAPLGPHRDPRYGEYATNIRESGEHLLALINDVLDLSRVGAGEYRLHPEWLDPGDVVQSVVRGHSEIAQTRGVSLRRDVAADLPPLWADPRALRQVLINLVSNALKFTPADGHVTVTVQRGDAGMLAIAIADTGPGIPEEEQEKVLQPFVQADNQANRHHEGTGLGLALSKQLTDLHGGHLVLDSTPGAGTTVTIHLPVAAANMDAANMDTGAGSAENANVGEASPLPA